MTKSEESRHVDPRVQRTRLLLHDALHRLLSQTSFESISVQDVAEEATVNRATFYAHYTDKYELLNCMTVTRFQRMLDERGVRFDGTCDSALRVIFLGVCDYLAQLVPKPALEKQFIDPYLESAIIAVVRRMSIEGLKQQKGWEGPLTRELVGTSVSWALYGAARGWAYTARRPSAEKIADNVVAMLARIIHPGLSAHCPICVHGTLPYNRLSGDVISIDAGLQLLVRNADSKHLAV